jgi:hypothetical protein
MLTAAGTEATLMLKASVAVCIGRLASFTWTLKLKAPVAVGVPLIAPLVALSVKPGGRDPLAIDHV